MHKRIRQYIGILAAVVAYYIVREGAHLITVLYYDVFRKINFMGLYIMGTVPVIYFVDGQYQDMYQIIRHRPGT